MTEEKTALTNQMNQRKMKETKGGGTTRIHQAIHGETTQGITLGVPPGSTQEVPPGIGTLEITREITALGPGPEQDLAMMICFRPGYMVGDLLPEILMTSG